MDSERVRPTLQYLLHALLASRNEQTMAWQDSCSSVIQRSVIKLSHVCMHILLPFHVKVAPLLN